MSAFHPLRTFRDVCFRPIADIRWWCDNKNMANLGSVFLAFATWAWSMSGPFQSMERITPEIAVERAAKCGLGPVTIRHEYELQSDILSAPEASSATESELRCLDDATGFGLFVELPSSVQPRFDAIREARASAIMMVEAREWLSKRGLLNRVPKYVAGTTDAGAFTRQVEQLCGAQTKGAFQSQYGPHALSPEWIKGLGLPPKGNGMAAMSCLLNVTTVAGFKVGFIGNEAYSR